MGSAPPKLTPRGALYQPFPFGLRAGVVVTCGAVASYLNPNALAALWLPARSRHEPDSDTPALSGPEYVFAASQESMPAVTSVPAKLTESAALYQPFAFGCRAGAALACGAVASYLSGNDPKPAFPALSRQLPLTT